MRLVGTISTNMLKKGKDLARKSGVEFHQDNKFLFKKEIGSLEIKNYNETHDDGSEKIELYIGLKIPNELPHSEVEKFFHKTFFNNESYAIQL